MRKPQLHERYQAVKMVFLGYPYDRIVAVLGRSIPSIVHYVDRFGKAGWLDWSQAYRPRTAGQIDPRAKTTIGRYRDVELCDNLRISDRNSWFFSNLTSQHARFMPRQQCFLVTLHPLCQGRLLVEKCLPSA